LFSHFFQPKKWGYHSPTVCDENALNRIIALPLAFSAIIVGTALAWQQGHFDPLVALLALITAGLLQILSNLANDYGEVMFLDAGFQARP
jgi:hypothetical protein